MSTYIGLDLHNNYSFVTAMDEKGKITAPQQKISNNEGDILNFMSQFEDPVVAVEATHNWYWLMNLFEDQGIESELTHAKKAKAIASAKIKTDKISSEVLAHLLRSDLLPTAFVLPREKRETRDLLRHRAALTGVRTGLKNRIHSVLAKFNLHCPFTDLFGKGGRAWLKQAPLPGNYQVTTDNYLTLIDTIDSQIEQVTEIIHGIAEHNPAAVLLDEIPGIDYYSALLVVMEVGDIKRFQDHRHFCSYLGIVPSTHTSGNTNYTGRITKEGNKWLRWIVIEAAQKAQLNPHNPYNRMYLKILRKKGHAKARVAVGRKIAVAIYHMLSKNEHFKLPLSLSRQRQDMRSDIAVG
jgi:transposase